MALIEDMKGAMRVTKGQNSIMNSSIKFFSSQSLTPIEMSPKASYFYRSMGMDAIAIKQDFNPWDVSSIFDFNFFCCPECEIKSQSKQDFVDHISSYHTWVSKFGT